MTQRSVATLFVILVCAVCGIGQASAASAVVDFALLGLARGQTLRLNVADIGTSDSTAIPAELNWMDSAGNLLSQSIVTVLRGQATFVDLHGDNVVTSGTRLEI